ncbi:hypothetical protein SAMN05720470_10832 [Fibrobacter sp. UWOV1]|uniref:hypothetical protein n=1 Tax=Fibrobacter sp. UWOV1 TaxID=1896215 RepID=UPI00091110C7|nr:hypothetical protein [Fibrobacter sp. UWOV1]SHL41892.1 hypothetical protein SAMN05720470_10832 [Fibrobacter sp. UWOV1]
MMDKLLFLAYFALSVYFVVAYFVTGNELALLVALWSGAMLEIRSRHNITIVMKSERRNDDDGNDK